MTVRPRLYADTASELSSLPDLSPRDGPTSAHRTRPAALSNAVVNSAGHAQSTRSQRQALVAGKPAAERARAAGAAFMVSRMAVTPLPPGTRRMPPRRLAALVRRFLAELAATPLADPAVLLDMEGHLDRALDDASASAAAAAAAAASAASAPEDGAEGGLAGDAEQALEDRRH